MNQKTLTGILLDDQTEFSLQELSQACATSTTWVIELVEEGVLDPIGHDQALWRFSGTSLQRARAAARLQNDLKINLAGIALALDLIDEVQTLHERLCRLETDNHV